MIRFNLGDKQIRALVDSESVREAKDLKLTIRSERVHLFDLETEEVL